MCILILVMNNILSCYHSKFRVFQINVVICLRKTDNVVSFHGIDLLLIQFLCQTCPEYTGRPQKTKTKTNVFWEFRHLLMLNMAFQHFKMHLKAHVVSLACFILAVACLLQFSLKSQFRARISEGLLYIEMILCFLRLTCTVFVNRFVLEFAMLSVLHKTLLYKKLSFA